jgi:hypothetical protein
MSVANVCKITNTNIEHFDEIMLVLQVLFGKYGVKDMLLDGGSNVNNILESLRKKLGLKRPQLAPFVMMVDKWKVQLIGFIRNLKIDLINYVYKISIIVLNMEHGIEAYSMLLIKPWLK